MDLKTAHAAAVNEGDIAKADKLVDQIADEKTNFLRAQAAQAVAQQAVPQESLELNAWKDANSWYNESEDLRTTADAFGFKFVQQNQGKVTPEQVLKHVSQKMAPFLEKHQPSADPTEVAGQQPVRFTSPNPVGGGRTVARSTPAAGGLRKTDLSEDESKAMKDFVKYGLGTEAEYLKQLKEVRG